MACYFDVRNCCAHTQVFLQSKHCASPTCQLKCFEIKTAYEHRYRNVLKMTGRGVKSERESGITSKKGWKVFGDLEMTKNNKGSIVFV